MPPCPLRLFCLNLAAVIVSSVTAQDDFGGGEDAVMDDSLLGSPGGNPKAGDPNAVSPTVTTKTIFEESISAMQQLGFIIGKKKY